MQSRPARQPHHGPSASSRWRLEARGAVVLVGGALTLVMAVGTAPTPLWPLYQSADRVTTPTITALAGAVVPGAMVSFLLLGHLSDRFGRRRVLVGSLTTSIAALLVMAASPSVTGMSAGRVLTGLALGLTAPTATAYLLDLGELLAMSRARAATVATAANLGGLALGPVLAGAVAEFLPRPLALTYLVLAVLLAVPVLGLPACPETVPPGGRAVRQARFALTPGDGRRFAAGAAGGFVGFAVTGIFAALGAIVVRGELGVASVLVGGLTTAMVFASSALAQLVVGTWPARRVYALGAVVLPIGLTLVVRSVAAPHALVYGAACIVTGAACGLLFKAGLVSSSAVALPASRAGVLAVHFSVAYVGMGLGAVAVAGLQTVLPTATAFGVVAAAFSAVAAAGAVATVRGDTVAARLPAAIEPP